MAVNNSGANSHDELRRIAARGDELDLKLEDEISRLDIETIAVELGISRDAVTRALSEAPPVEATKRPRLLRHAGAIACFGFASGIAIGRTPEVVYPGILFLCGVSLLLAVDAKRPHPLVTYLSRSAGLWGGFFATTVLTGGWSDFGAARVICGSIALGLAIITGIKAFGSTRSA